MSETQGLDPVLMGVRDTEIRPGINTIHKETRRMEKQANKGAYYLTI
jgi:hypothetical protein